MSLETANENITFKKSNKDWHYCIEKTACWESKI